MSAFFLFKLIMSFFPIMLSSEYTLSMLALLNVPSSDYQQPAQIHPLPKMPTSASVNMASCSLLPIPRNLFYLISKDSVISYPFFFSTVTTIFFNVSLNIILTFPFY